MTKPAPLVKGTYVRNTNNGYAYCKVAPKVAGAGLIKARIATSGTLATEDIVFLLREQITGGEWVILGSYKHTAPAAHIAPGSITTDLIADGAVTDTKVADGAITAQKIQDQAISTLKIAQGAVTTDLLADGAVASQKIQDQAIVVGKLADGSVVTSKLADLAVSTAKIVDNAINTMKLADGAVDTAKIVDNAITNAQLALNSVDTQNIVENAVGNAQLALNAVDVENIVDGAVAASLGPGGVTADLIAAGAISSDKVDFTARTLGANISTVSDTAPTNPLVNDLWVDTSSGNTLKQWNGTEWVSVPVAGTGDIAVGSITAEDVNFTARTIGANITTTSATAPANPLTNDLWIDTANGNVIKQWNGTSWATFQSGPGALAVGAVGSSQLASNAVTTAKIAVGAITNALLAPSSVSADKVSFTARTIGANTTTTSATAPTNPLVNDLWIDSSNGNLLKQWNGTTWVTLQDAAITAAQTAANSANTAATTAQTAANTANTNAQAAQTAANNAATAANTAQTTANGKIKTFVAATAPTASEVGDIWIDTANGNRLNQWNGTAWTSYQVGTAAIAAGAITTAQVNFTARQIGGVTTTVAGTAPTSPVTGDLWINSASGNALQRWSGTAWVSVQDTAIAAAASAAAAAQTTANNAQAAATTAQNTAAGKITTFIQATAPTATETGDLWIDTGNGNLLKRWSGTAWTSVQDAAIATAQSAATAANNAATTANTNAQAAQTAANNAQTAANAAQTTANGKNKIYRQATQPTGATAGDTWFDTSNGNRVSVYDGSAWQVSPLQGVAVSNLDAGSITTGSLAAARIAAGTITGTMMAANTVTAAQIAASTITSAQIAANTITAADIAGGTITAAQIASGTITATQIATGTITASQIASGTITANELAANSVTASQLAANSVTAAALQAGAVTAASIAAGTITSAQLAANSVTASQIAAGAVAATSIAAGAITADKLSIVVGGGNFLTNSSFENGTVGFARVATGTVIGVSTNEYFYGTQSGLVTSAAVASWGIGYALDYTQFQSNTTYTASAWVYVPSVNGPPPDSMIFRITGAGFAGNHNAPALAATNVDGWYRMSVTFTTIAAMTGNGTIQLYSNVVPAASGEVFYTDAWQFEQGNIPTAYAPKVDEILPGTINAAMIQAGTITAAQLAANSVTTSQIAAGAVLAANIASGTITSTQIAAGTIQAANIAANTITSAQIAANTITAADIAAATITSAQLAANSVTATQLVAGAVTTAKLAAGAVTATQIAAGTITSNQIAAGGIAANNIAAGAITANKLDIVVGGGNLLSNSSFEGSTSGYASLSDTGSIALTNAEVYYGDSSCLVSSSPVSSYGSGTYGQGPYSGAITSLSYGAGNYGQGVYQPSVTVPSGAVSAGINAPIPYALLQPSTVYTASCYVWCPSGGVPPQNLVFQVTPSIVDSVVVAPSLVAADVNGWYRMALTFTTSANLTNDGALQLYSPTGTTFYTDAWQLEPGDVPTAYAPKADEILPGSITANMIASNAITAQQIAAGTITSALIASNTIVAGNIASGTITAVQIATGTITATQIAAGTITAQQIAAGTITAQQIAANSITSALIASQTIVAGDIATGTITGNEIAGNTITAGKMVAGTITAASGIIANAAIGTAQIQNLAVTNALIANGAITTAKIGTAQITTALIANAQITNALVANAAIGTANIQNLAVSTALIQDAAITNAKIANLAVGTANIQNAAITNALIDNLAVSTANIQDAAIVTAKIGTLAVGDAQISSLSVGKISAGMLTAAVTISGSIATAATGARVVLDGTGLHVYDATNTLVSNFSAADGSAVFKGSILSGSSITGATVTGGTLTGATIQTAATGARVVLDTTGINVYNSAGAVTFTASSSTGALNLTGTMGLSGTIQTATTGARVVLSSAGINVYNASNVATFTAAAATGALTLAGTLTVTGTISGGMFTGGNFSTTQTAGDLHIEIINGVSRNRITWVPPTAGFTGGIMTNTSQIYVDETNGVLTLKAPVLSGVSPNLASTLAMDPSGNVTTTVRAGASINLNATGASAVNFQTGTGGSVAIACDDFTVTGVAGVQSFFVDPTNLITIGGGGMNININGQTWFAKQVHMAVALDLNANLLMGGDVVVPAAHSINSGDSTTSVHLTGGVVLSGGVNIINGPITCQSPFSTIAGSGVTTFNTAVNFNQLVTITDVNLNIAGSANIVLSAGEYIRGDSAVAQKIACSQNTNIGFGYNQNAATATFYVGGSVVSTIGSAGAYNQSTIRSKRNVNTYKVPSHVVDKIRHVSYMTTITADMPDPDAVFHGVIAEEINEIEELRSFVGLDEDGSPNGVNYGGLALATALSVNAKLNETIQRLEDRLAKLEA